MVSKKIESLVQRFLNGQSMLRTGAGLLAERWKVERKDIYEAKDEARRRLKAERKKNVKRLFFDIETAPNIAYVWETGYRIRVPHNHLLEERQIICISYKWWGENKVHNIYWYDKDGLRSDLELLKKFIPILTSADEVVAHYGDGFDIPMIAGRAAYHNLKFPTKFRSFDTKKKIKAQFKLNSYSLDYCTKFFNVAGKKMSTGGFDLWADLLQNIDLNLKEKMKDKMIEYCNRDVIALEDLYNRIQRYTKPVTNMSTLHGGKRWGCPHCGSQDVSYLKPSTTPRGIVQRHMECNTCESHYDISSKTFFAFQEWESLQNN